MLLDTNILSELMRPTPDSNVMAWFGQQRHTFYTSAITRAEILLGIALLPNSKRRENLAHAAEKMFAGAFANRCLSFDNEAADEYALLVSARHRAGLPISTEDGQIAAIALRHTLPLATRNSKDFVRVDGLTVINPWE
jgi:toxin FitB